MRVHIVQKGDTLWKIAKQYGIGFDELKRLNAQLANPDYIVPGMEIFLPEKSGMTGKEAVKGDKSKVVHEMKEKEMEWKPTKELQYVEEPAEVPQPMPQPMPMPMPEPQPEPTYNPYAFMPSIYQMAYMPTYQQPIYQMPVYQQPILQQPVQQPMQQQPVFEESTTDESVEQMPFEEIPYEHEEYQQPMMYHPPMHHPPMHHPSPCGCNQPMFQQPAYDCHQPMFHHQQYGCHQPMHHHSPCGCHQPMHQYPMHQQPMFQQPMYQQPMYYQPMDDQLMYQPVDVCESSRPFCPDKEEQVKGYYEDIKQIENAAKSPCAPNPFPHSTQQHWR